MQVNFYEILWIFLIYAFIGWCAEVAFAAVNEGNFVNRGFLNGPYCPIYGAGVLIVVALLTPLQENGMLLFAGSFLLTSVLEYITGFVLEKVFGNKWWDYSDMPFNIRGYVCLKFSIMWGFGCMFIVNQLHPHIMRFIRWFPYKVGVGIAVFVVIAFSADLVVTVNTILKFNKRLRMLEEIAAGMHKVSDEIGEDIFEKVSDITEKREIAQEYLEDKRADMEEYIEDRKSDVEEFLQDKKEDFRNDILEVRARREELSREYKKIMEQRQFGVKRMMKAFPRLQSRDHDKMLQLYKEFWKK